MISSIKTDHDIKTKITELKAASPDWFMSLTKMDLSPELQAQVTEHLPYIQAGMLLGRAWALGSDEDELVASLFSAEQLEKHGLKLDDFGFNS